MQKREVKKYVQAELDTKRLRAFTKIKREIGKTTKRQMLEAVDELIAKYERLAS